MHCYVYASLRKADSYLWLTTRDAFEPLPAELKALLGPLRLALEVDLHPQRRLPHEDTAQVLANLARQGWHLQLPPSASLATDRELDYRQAPREPAAR